MNGLLSGLAQRIQLSMDSIIDPLVLKGSSRYIEGSMDPRVDMDDGFKTGQWTTSNISEHVPSWKLYQIMVFTTFPLSHSHTHARARERERVAKIMKLSTRSVFYYSWIDPVLNPCRPLDPRILGQICRPLDPWTLAPIDKAFSVGLALATP